MAGKMNLKGGKMPPMAAKGGKGGKGKAPNDNDGDEAGAFRRGGAVKGRKKK